MRTAIKWTALFGALLLAAGCAATRAGNNAQPARLDTPQQAGVTNPADCACNADTEVCVPSVVTSTGSYPTGARFHCVAHDQLADCTVDVGVCSSAQRCVANFGCAPQADPSLVLPPDAGAPPESIAVSGCRAFCLDVQQAAGEGAPCAPRDPDSTSLATVCAAGLFCVPSAVTPDGYLVAGATATCNSSVTLCTDAPWLCDDEPGTTCMRDLSCNPDRGSLECRSICAPIAADSADDAS